MKRASLVLLVCVVLFVATGFAATRKSERHHNRLTDWSDASLRNGDLPDEGSSVSGVGNLTLSQGGGPGGVLTLPPGTPDDWNGGTGNWSNAGNWNNGVPGANSDVVIYTGGGFNRVTLDVGTATINSLTLGGVLTGSYSTLTDGGSIQTLTVNGGLTVGQSGNLSFSGSGSQVTANADSSNAGFISLSNGASLQINGNFINTNSASAFAGSVINITGTLTNTSFGDFCECGGGTPSIGNVLNSGSLAVENGTTLNVGGNFTNLVPNASLFTFGATVNIVGSLTNDGQISIQVPGDIANIGTLINNAFLAIDTGATLNLTNQPGGITDVVAGAAYLVLGSFNAGGHPAFANLNSVEGGVTLYGQNLTITPGSGTLTISNRGGISLDYNSDTQMGTALTINGNLTNSGFADTENGSTLQINGSVNNSGTLATDYSGHGGGNTLNITGNLTNQTGGSFYVAGAGDIATLGGLDNAGSAGVSNGSTLRINGDVNNSNSNSHLSVFGGGTLNIAGTLTNAGFVMLGQGNDMGDMATIGGNLTNAGWVIVQNGSTLQINGNVNNSFILTTDPSFFGHDGNTLNITGNLTNSYAFSLNGHGDMATIGNGLTNSADGFVDVENGSTLHIGGDVTTSGTMATSYDGTYYSNGNTLTIAGNLSNQAGGEFILNGSGDMASVGNGLTNDAGGFVEVQNGSTLKITGDVNNFGTMETRYVGGNTLSIVGNLTNNGDFGLLAPGDQGSISGDTTNNGTGGFFVAYGAMGTIGGNLTNAVGGIVDVESGGTLTISGDVTNSGIVATDYNSLGGGNTITINGTLTNGGSFELLGPADMATLGSLTNNAGGFVDVEGGSTLNISGDVTNFAGGGGQNGIFTGYKGSGGNTLNIGGMLTNNGDFELLGAGDMASISGNVTNSGNFYISGTGSMASMGGLNNAGLMLVENGSTLQVNGDATNSWTLYTGYFLGGGNTLSITGTLTNQAGAQFGIFRPRRYGNDRQRPDQQCGSPG